MSAPQQPATVDPEVAPDLPATDDDSDDALVDDVSDDEDTGEETGGDAEEDGDDDGDEDGEDDGEEDGDDGDEDPVPPKIVACLAVAVMPFGPSKSRWYQVVFWFTSKLSTRSRIGSVLPDQDQPR